MTLRPLILGLLALICASLPMTLGHLAYAATDSEVQCLQRASSDRSAALNDAYDRYAEDTKEAADLLKKSQTDVMKLKDINKRSQELQRITARYSTDVMQANQTLTYAVTQTWNDYVARQQSCGFGSSSAAPIYDSAWQYAYQTPWWGGGYGGYGGYYGQGGYGWYNGWPWQRSGLPSNYLSPTGYMSYDAPYCPQIVLPTIPAGCGYECSRDDRGCPTCEVSCRTAKNDPLRCACPQTFAPVCGSDSRTYTNSCFAQCADVRIVYGGGCAY